jgi:hypothetical protein
MRHLKTLFSIEKYEVHYVGGRSFNILFSSFTLFQRHSGKAIQFVISCGSGIQNTSKTKDDF